MNLSNNAVRHYNEMLFWDLGWLLVAIVLAIAFVTVVRGRWRFTVIVPLVICALVAFGIVVLWPHASA